MARLILIRHGESLRTQSAFTTDHDRSPPRPRERERGRNVAAAGPVSIYTSPSCGRSKRRARRSVLGSRRRRGLREQDFGALRGQPYESVGRDPLWHSDRWRFRPPGGETLEEVGQRAGPALDEIAARHLGSEVIVVSHGGVMAALHAWTRSQRFEGSPQLSANAAGYVVTFRSARYEEPFPGETDEDDGEVIVG
jgi:broad specificity phosphatase PhoE